MNAADLEDIGATIAWLAAIRADLECLAPGELPAGLNAETVRLNSLRCLAEAEQAVERVALGTNRQSRRAATKG